MKYGDVVVENQEHVSLYVSSGRPSGRILKSQGCASLMLRSASSVTHAFDNDHYGVVYAAEIDCPWCRVMFGSTSMSSS